MGLAIGAAAITNLVDLARRHRSHRAGRRWARPNSVQAVSEAAFAAISSADKLFAGITNATHRSFDSTYCAQLQSAAATTKSDPKAILDLHTVGLIAASAPGFMSGRRCTTALRRFFTSPENIQRVVASTFNAEYFCSGARTRAWATSWTRPAA